MPTLEDANVSKALSRSSAHSGDIKIHELISHQLDVAKMMGKSQREIANEVGYEQPAMINMFKAGTVKVPIDKVPALAKALNIDPAFLFRLCMMQYWKENADVVSRLFGTVLTENETKIIEKIRAVSRNSDPALNRDREAKLKAIFDT